MFRPGQVSNMLQIATSTLRKYATYYTDFLSDSTRRKHRRYTDQDIATLKKVCELRDEGVPLDEIKGQLKIVEDGGIGSTLALIPEIAEQFEAFRAMMAKMQQDAQDQAETIETMQTTIDDLTARLDQLDRPFWQRLFNRSDPEA